MKSVTAIVTVCLPTDFVLGHLSHMRSLNNSHFCVLPWRHFFESSAWTRSLYIDSTTSSTAGGREFLWMYLISGSTVDCL
jgi:hypothetical protein